MALITHPPPHPSFLLIPKIKTEINDIAQDCGISTANTLEIPQSCTMPSRYSSSLTTWNCQRGWLAATSYSPGKTFSKVYAPPAVVAVVLRGCLSPCLVRVRVTSVGPLSWPTLTTWNTTHQQRSHIVLMPIWVITHWGRVTHIYVSRPDDHGSDNGLSPIRRQAIIWTNEDILSIRPRATHFNGILFGIQKFSFKKMHFKISSTKWRPFCLGLNVLIFSYHNSNSACPASSPHKITRLFPDHFLFFHDHKHIKDVLLLS